MDDRVAFQKAINANPRDHAPQLIFADWLDEHGDHRKADFWRRQNSDSIVGLGGRGGRGGLGGLGGLGGRGGPYHPEAPIVLIPGENAVVFVSDGYYTSVLVGHVAQELPHGWIVDPCRELLSIGESDTLIELAAGKKSGVRKRAKLTDLIDGGFRVPFGCASMLWHGELPQ